MPLSADLTLQIRFCDVDSLHHVNNAFYLSYFELARMELFNRSGLEINWKKQGFILARVEIDYLLPVKLNDAAGISCFVSRVGNKSFDIDYLLYIHAESGKIPACRGKSVQVCFDYEKNRSIPIPEEWKKKMT